MKVIVGNKNITEYINESSYKMDAEDVFEKWQDGNRRTHKELIRTRVKGEFTLALGLFRGFSLEDFNAVLTSSTHNGVLTASVWVTNKCEQKAIECYATVTTTKHRKLSDGTYMDVVKVTLEEC